MANNLRLTVLAEHLETIAVKPKRFFDIRSWIKRLDPKQRAKHGCGMSACAGGEATYIRSFQKAGLTRDSGNEPIFGGHSGYDALANFLSISKPASVSLFSPRAYGKHPSKVRPRDVAQRIRAFVELSSNGGLV